MKDRSTRGWKVLIAAGLIGAMLLVPGIASGTAKVKRGMYYCWMGSTPDFANIKIHPKKKYSVHGDKGRYTHKPGSKWILFKTGPLKNVYRGKHIVKNGTHQIEKWYRLKKNEKWSYMSTCTR